MGQRGPKGESKFDLSGNTIARYESHGNRYEIVVDPHKAWLWKQGEEVNEREIFVSTDVFLSVSKGLRPSDEDLHDAFETTSQEEIAKRILREGTLLLTQEQRDEFLADKRKEVIEFIHRNCINPQNNKPHPPKRLENAMREAGVTLSYHEDAKDQALEVIEQIRTVLPIRMEAIKLAIKVPASLGGPLYGDILNYGEVLEEEWTKGSFVCVVRMPAGVQAEFLDLVNSKTKGKAQVKVMERIS